MKDKIVVIGRCGECGRENVEVDAYKIEGGQKAKCPVCRIPLVDTKSLLISNKK